MDPRLSPKLAPQPHDVVNNAARPAPPQSPSAAQTPAPAQANSIEQPMVPELVAAFPVKQPEIPSVQSTAAVPAQAGSPPTPNVSAQPEDDLDKILQDVNKRVKAPEEPTPSAKKELGKKILNRASKSKDKTKNPNHFGPVVVVLIVVLMLSATAILAYREGNRTAVAAKQAGKVGTSYTASSAIQEAGGTLVRPADLDDYAQTLQTKLNSLNDSQDFTTDSLSDQVLGL